MYVHGMSGTGVGGSHPLPMLFRQFPWISPGEVLDDGAVAYRVLKKWPGGVRVALYDRGGIMVDSQDFFQPGVSGAQVFHGVGGAQVFHGIGGDGIFGGRSGIFGAMGDVGAFPTMPGQPNWGMFSPREGIFGAMGTRPKGTAPQAYAFSGLGAYNTPTTIGVSVVQRGLIAAGVSPSPGSADNTWGPRTRASLSA